ncbi:helix-turn-helix domain-containing protein [Rossellomorea vietnamensis]|uniref:helix-turn-helix domain-containing protein n=1 Tax=Rossellomorea vietnamensis TaxID=218284 RepID=UPI003D2AD4EB
MTNKDKDRYEKLIGVYVKQRRNKLGLTQAEFGEKVDLSEKAVGRIERAERSPLGYTLYKIHKNTGISIDQLFQDIQKSSDSEED